MQDEEEEPICKEIWSKKIGLEKNDETWQNLFKACTKAVTDNELIWFQYKILFNILNTNEYLNKIKVKDSNLCRLCGEYPETIPHLFVQCKEVQELWQDLKRWIRNKLSIHIELCISRKLLGYEEYDEMYWPLNFILIIVRKYIFWCASKSFKLNFYFLQNMLENKFKEHKTIAAINQTESKFNKRWEVWQNLF